MLCIHSPSRRFHFFGKSYVLVFPTPPNPFSVRPVVQPSSRLWRLRIGASGGASPLEQQGGDREEQQQEAALRSGCCASDPVVVWREGVQSRPVARTLTPCAHSASRAADVVTWGNGLKTEVLQSEPH